MFFRAVYLFAKSLRGIDASLKELCSLYKADLAARGIMPADPSITDPVEVLYGSRSIEED